MARRANYDEDAYAPVGTPFDPLETEEDVHKAKARKDKEHYVLDEQGRRRFHGAFTGGFSAGYYNTVGSKEGWTPSTFLSSRETKSEFSGQKPEDFMDAEDLGAHGIAPRQVSTRPNFQQQSGSGGGGGLKRPNESQLSVIPGEAPLQNLIIPARTSVGARLLRSMGWREGQGVGPRIQRSTAAGERVYGCSLPQSAPVPSAGGGEPLPEEVRGFAFAPRDVSLRQFEGKEDMHGIGYRGMEERAVLGGRETRSAVHGMSGEAFGVGALEEEDVEDHVYGEESMTSYDVTLAGEGDVEMERKFGWTGGIEDSWSLKSFTKATKPHAKTKVYHTPEVPRDFVPIHRFSILNIKSVGGGAEQSGKPVTVSERNQLLADTPGSVFSLMSAADRERLRRVAGTSSSSDKPLTQTQPQTTPTLNPAPQPRPPAPPTSISQLTAPRPNPGAQSQPLSLAQQTSSSLGDTTIDEIKPFPLNPLKQARYEAFLNGRRLHSDSESVGMTEWERQREWDEFSRTRRVYQPLSVSLSTRFTREAGSEMKEKSPEPDSVQAARANMFGVLTREVQEWHPHPVLCKRFNVPDPYPNDGLVGTVTEKHKQLAAATASRHIQFLPVQKTAASSVTPGNQPPAVAPEIVTPLSRGVDHSGGPSQPAVTRQREIAKETEIAPNSRENNETTNHPPGAPDKDEVELEEAKEEARPPMDLFKAIFAESSSSESEAEAQQEEETSPPRPREAAGTQKEEASVVDQGSRKTRWQDLSAVTSGPLTTAADNSSHSNSGKMAPTISEGAAAPLRETAHNGENTALENAGEKQTFGPALPPGFGNREPERQREKERERQRERGREKEREREKGQTHHKTSSRKERRRKHRSSDEEESHSHRKRKEKKKSKHKH